MKTVNIIKENQLCTGCGTCNVICPHDAITMSYSIIGQLMPKIDSTKCTNCGLCYTNCPSYDKRRLIYKGEKNPYIGNVLDVYIGKSDNEKIFKNSQSGGMVTAILSFLFDVGLIDNAIVCSNDYAEKCNPKAVIVSNSRDLLSFQKSSYVQIDMISALKNVRENKRIAIVGTSCVIQGAYYLKRLGKFNISYLIGLICDRTLCKAAADVLIDGYFAGKKKKIIWRDKTTSYKNACLIVERYDGKQKKFSSERRFLLKDPFTPPRCRLCFDKLNIYSDITCGDPWGMENVDWTNGASLILVRSKKGKEIIDQMSEVSLTPSTIEMVIKGQKITRRINNVKNTIAEYRNKGWLLPTYYDDIEKTDVDPYTSNVVNTFLQDSKLDEIALKRKYIRYVRKQLFKSRIIRYIALIRKTMCLN